MRWHHTLHPTTNQQHPHSTHNAHSETRTPNCHVIIKTSNAVQGLQTDIRQMVRKHDFDKTPRNTTSTERNAIVALKSENDITVTRSDQGGELVVVRESQLHQFCLDHVIDTISYEQLQTDPTNATRTKSNKNLNRILTDRHFPKALTRNLQTSSTAKTQHFYALPETHNEDLKIRPIVSACRGIFDRLRWLLQQICRSQPTLITPIPMSSYNDTTTLTKATSKV